MILTIEASDAADLRNKIQDLAAVFGIQVVIPSPKPPAAPDPVKVQPQKTKKSSKKTSPAPESIDQEVSGDTTVDSTSPAPHQEPNPEPTSTPVQDDGSSSQKGAGKNESVESKEDALNAFSKYADAKGLTAARDLLAKFGAQRFSEVQSKDFGALIAECTK